MRVRDDTFFDLIYNKSVLDIFLLPMKGIHVARNLAEMMYFCSSAFGVIWYAVGKVGHSWFSRLKPNSVSLFIIRNVNTL